MDEKEFAKSAAMETAVIRKSLNNLMGIVNGLVCDNQLADTEIHVRASNPQARRHSGKQREPTNQLCGRRHDGIACVDRTELRTKDSEGNRTGGVR